MTDYTDIGLDENLNSLTSLPNRGTQTIKDYIDNQINEITRPGGLNYTNTALSGKDFKAIVSSDNSQGNFTNIQNALNYVDGLGGGKILIKSGTYTVDSNLELKESVAIVGEAVLNTRISFNGAYGFVGTGVHGCSLEDITIADSSSTLGAFYVKSSSLVNLDNVYFTDNNAAGSAGCDIHIFRSEVGVTGCYGIRSDCFVRLDTSDSNTVIRDCAINQPKNDVFVAGTVGRAMISNNDVLNATKSIISGDWLYSKFVGNLARFASQTSTDWHVNISGTSTNQNISFVGNHFSAGGAGGMYLDGVTFIEVVGNNIAGNGTAGTNNGLYLKDTGYCQFSGNFFKSDADTADAVLVDGNSDGNTFTGNYMWASGTSSPNALNIGSSTCNGNVVVGNKFSGGTADSGSDTVWANNS